MVLVWWLVRSIMEPLQQAMSVTDAIASEDLTMDLNATRKDEFSHTLRSLSANRHRPAGIAVTASCCEGRAGGVRFGRVPRAEQRWWR
jgi:methyl-accepting chemotaxis protein